MPGFRRPRIRKGCETRSFMPRAPRAPTGIHTSRPRGNSKPGGITPTKVYGSPVEEECFADCAGAPAENAMPQGVARQKFLGTAGFLIVRCETAADRRLDAENVEKTVGDDRVLN